MKNKILLILILITTTLFTIDLPILKTRLNYYTNESNADILVRLNSQDNLRQDTLLCSFLFKNDLLMQNYPLKADIINQIPLPIENLPIGINKLSVIIKSTNIKQTIPIIIKKLPHKKNIVKIDLFSGGLIVDDLPFFPFGFYCYSPLQPTLPEEEIVKGFNMISPYQQIEKKTLQERKKYMDRCAQLGMKVHYNLCSVAGGGGAGSALRKLSEKKLEELLIKEVNTFKDHPALLAWYIGDEPALNGIKAEKMIKIYQKIKKIDPYHPISMVFMRYDKAEKFEHAMDIVMADPYPIPDRSVNIVANVTKRLASKFKYKKPVWIVPQAFGGNEWWSREPTKQELRVMTHLAIANGATGIQYFIRHGLNGFPKSTTTWAECGALALETAEITPYVLSGNKTDNIECDSSEIELASWKIEDNFIILAVNKQNYPSNFSINFKDSINFNKLYLPFENRSIEVIDNAVADIVNGFGSKVYQTNFNNKYSKIDSNNLVLDPSFEDNVSVGVPSYCYANAGSDRGSTYFIDSRIAYDQTHSLRLNTPTYGKGPLLKFFKVKLNYNQTYRLSIWAKAAPKLRLPKKKRGFFARLFFPKKKEKKFIFKLQLNSQKEFFELSENWQEYSIVLRQDGAENGTYLAYPMLELIGQGTAWFDLMQIMQKK